MKIRRNLILTYFSLILIFIIFITLIFYTNLILNRIGDDIDEINDLKNQYTEILVNLNNINLNWSNGIYLSDLVQRMTVFENRLIKLSQEIFKKEIYSASLKKQLLSLQKMWTYSTLTLNELIDNASSREFQQHVAKLNTDPSMQSLNDLILHSIYSGSKNEKISNYHIYQVIDSIESYSTYHDTFSNLLSSLLFSTGNVREKIYRYQILIISSLSFIFFLSFFLLSFLFSSSISKRITTAIKKLTSFLGKSIEKIDFKHQNELESLSNSVDLLIDHYSNISDAARKLSKGDITSEIEVNSDNDVIGSALKNVLHYLRELHEASEIIQQGKYNVTINVKSENDLLSKTFNLMLDVINEKIGNLKNMIDTIEEGIIVIDEDMNISEMNKKILSILECKKKSLIKDGKDFIEYFVNDKQAIIESFNGKSLYNYMSEIKTSSKIIKPVKISSKNIDKEAYPKKIMFFVSDESWKVRLSRERELMKTQAELAELRALRAQINPHFLFNTLNTVNELIETTPDSAVDIIDKLSELFRYVLYSTKQNLVSINEELKYVQMYLDIESVRFEDRLILDYNIDLHVLEYMMPPMLLQPLIENVIQHGEDLYGHIYLRIDISKNKNLINFAITDRGNSPIPDKNLSGHDGTGIKNVNGRLKTLYNGELIFSKRNGKGLTVSFSVPVIK